MPSGKVLIKTSKGEQQFEFNNIFKELSNISLDLEDFKLFILDVGRTKLTYNIKYIPVSGIYCIRNIVNNKRCIGMSSNIFMRWGVYLSDCLCQHKKAKLYNDMNKDTLPNFEFSILELTDNLEERERYWIAYYNSTKDYNTTIGGYPVGDQTKRTRTVTEDMVHDIRTRYANHETKHIVYQDYKDVICESNFHKIWNGTTWKNIMPEVFTEENAQFHKTNFGFKKFENPRAKITPEIVETIRKKLNQGMKPIDIYEDYKDLFSERYFCGGLCKKIQKGIF